jgi:uncharacterized membrane protein
LHPFDIKTVLFAKHAQHVVLIHFPIALFIIGVLFDFLAQWKKQHLLAAVAYYNLLVAAIATIPVVVTGMIAWQWELEGQKLKGILLMHLVMGCVSSMLIWVVWFIHRKTQRKEGEVLPGYRLPIEAVAAVLVAVTGHLGGFLSGVNGPG